MSVQLSLLQNVYLFKSLNSEALEKISELVETETIAAGGDIFCEGDKALALYLIKHGSVHIRRESSKGDKIEVAALGTGSHFGEMSFVDDEPRSASATAVEKSEILTIPYDRLRALLEDRPQIAIPFYKELSHFLCGRLRVTTTDLSFSREKNLTHF